MNLQKSVMLEYLKLQNNPSLRKMNQDTGIQITRLFRLMNGASMRIDEYEIFIKRVMVLKGATSSFLELVTESLDKLSLSSKREIEEILTRRVALWSLKNSISEVI